MHSSWPVFLRFVLVCLLAVGKAGAQTRTLPDAGSGPAACPFCDLRNAPLAGRDLRDANLSGADLSGADLSGVNLSGAALVSANLTGTDLRNAVFSDATDLTAANLTNAKLGGAKLAGAMFAYATTTGADLGGADTARAFFAPRPAMAATARYFCGEKDTTELKNVRYVAPSGTDGPACGASLTAPCATIQRGILNCSGTDCTVLVAYAEYPLQRSLGLAGGVSVYGGCVMQDQGSPALFSLIRGPDGVPAVIATRIVPRTIFQSFAVIAGKGRQAAGATSSIAFASQANTGLILQSVSLTAGGAASPVDGRRGVKGFSGEDANHQEPGRSDRQAQADGGRGGDLLRDGRDGWPGGSDGPPTRGGRSSGGRGDPGRQGRCGEGGKASPDLIGAIGPDFAWRPSTGGSGARGGYGAGGGGGGGNVLARGGGGGAGAEGGSGGEGAEQGGASIGLLIVGGELAFNSGKIHAGAGATGAAGGGGGLLGGKGGLPGEVAKTGGPGGPGGDGAPGSGGAGGNGGPAFVVATAGDPAIGDGTLHPTSVAFFDGIAGRGGNRGDGGNPQAPCTVGEMGKDGMASRDARLPFAEGAQK